MTDRIAKGEFTVNLEPQADALAEAGGFARLTLEKKFTGDLEGSSTGQMLGAQSGVEGSAGYVAMEKFSGSLHGRTGSFQLQHSGCMQGGEQFLDISVVPDSGSGELEGIHGVFSITIENGKHYYEFDYAISES